MADVFRRDTVSYVMSVGRLKWHEMKCKKTRDEKPYISVCVEPEVRNIPTQICSILSLKDKIKNETHYTAIAETDELAQWQYGDADHCKDNLANDLFKIVFDQQRGSR